MSDEQGRHPVSVRSPFAVHHDYRAGRTAPVDDALRSAIAALEAGA